MTLTFPAARKILQGRIGDSSDDQAVDDALNQAQREVARARKWPELMKRKFFNTEAAYETGTVATNGTTTVTLTGGVWPATVASAKYRFALSTSDPWYEVATRVSDTEITLTDAYVDDDQTASKFIVYRSNYSLDATTDRVEELWIHDQGRMLPLENAVTDQHATAFVHFPSGPGTPMRYLNIERDSSGNRQIMLGPQTPDDIFRVEYTFRRKTIDGTFSGNLDESRWPVILAKASEILYEPEFPERALQAEAKYRRLLDAEWANENESETQGIRIGDTRLRYPMSSGDLYYGTLLGYGTVSDPS